MKCTCCDSVNFEHLWKNLEKPSARHKTQPLDVQICRDCGLVCLDLDETNRETLHEYYETSNTFEKPGPLPEGHKALREHQVDWIYENLPTDLKLETALDVGCGAGYVPHLLKEKGLKMMGTDLSPAMIQNLKDLYGIDGVQGPFSANLVDNRKFDMISCITALEHMYDPSHEIKEMSKCLNDDGILFIEVPDAENPRDDTIVDHLAFDHLWHFSIRTMARTMENCGFKILATFHRFNPLNSGNPEWTLRVLGQKVSGDFEKKFQDNDYERQMKALKVYKEKHKKYLASFQDKIDEISKNANGKPVAVFPGGEHTATLFKRFDLSNLNIQCIFDNDSAVVGKELFGVKIRHGSEAGDPEIKVYLLSTTNHEKSIYEQLKKKNPDCEVYGLYNKLD